MSLDLFGWVKPTDTQQDRILSSLPMPIFSDVYSSIKDSGKGKVLLLSDFVKKLHGKHIGQIQVIGDCVSFGAAHAVDHTYAAEILMKGDFEEWLGLTSTEDIYGGSRVQIGNGQLGSGDGSIGSWAAKYVNQYGTLLRQKYEKDDLSVYSGNRAKQWGMPRVGTPSYLLPIAAQYKIRTVSLIRTYEEARDAIANGYAVTVASNVGFTSQRDSEGFLRQSGSWAHQMCARKGTVIKGDRPKKVEDISIGDKVYDMYGDLQTVTQIHKRTNKGKIIRIKVFGREPIYLTPNHPVLVFRKEKQVLVHSYSDIALYANKDYKLNSKSGKACIKNHVATWVDAGDLEKDDLIICPKTKLGNVVDNFKINFKDVVLNKNVSWLFGLYAADGCSTKSHKVVITLGAHEEKIIDRCVSVFKDEFGLNPKLKQVGKAVRVIVYSAELANFMLAAFGKKDTKIIPDLIMKHADLQSVLDGFYDGDGSLVNDTKKKIVNCNPIMIEQLHDILLYLRYSPYINKLSYKDKTYGNNWNDKYEISWDLNPKRENNWWSKDNYIMKISDVTILDSDEEVYNFEVENTNSYIANGIVVHNCFVGVDDSYKRPGLLCLNSWPYSWVSGPTRHDMPPGSFWVDVSTVNRMLGQGDSFVFSDRAGFPKKKLKLNWV